MEAKRSSNKDKKQMRVESSMIRLLAYVLPLVLLSGCTGVSQEKYDGLKSQCDSEKADLNAQLSSRDSRVIELTGKISECNSQKQTMDAIIRTKDLEVASLKNDSGILASARAKAGRIAQYELLAAYYNDAYGPGKIANSVRLNRIDAQAAKLNDAPLYASWTAVRNCGGITDCGSAKDNFTKAIDSRISSLAFEIADIVK